MRGGNVIATRIDVGADGGSGSYTQHAGRVVAPRMDLGLGGGSATLNMIGGTLSLGTDANPGSLRVGPDGDATVLQSGGTIELVGAGATLEIGGSPGRQANFVIEGGSLSAAIAP